MANDELMRLAERVEALATDWTSIEEAEKRDAIAADLRALAQRAPKNGRLLAEATEMLNHPSKDARAFAQDVLDSLQSPQNGAVPEGWHLVPVDGLCPICRYAYGSLACSCKPAEMLAAAPAPEAEPKECPYCGADEHDGACEPQPVDVPEAERAKDEAGAQSLAEMCAAGRAHNGWTLRQAEAETGVSNALISQIETGKQDNPTLRVLSALTRAYGLNPSSVLGLTAHLAPPPAGQPEGVEALAALIANDGYACTFQSMGQYRTALLREARRLASGPKAVKTDAEETTPHAIRAFKACIRDLKNMIEDAGDYGLDDGHVGALETAVESIELRLASAQRAGKDAEA